MIDEESYVRFLVKHNLTQGQFLMLHLVQKKRPDLIKLYKNAFPSGDDSMIGQYFITDLFNKEFVTKDSKGQIKLTEKFLSIYIDKRRAFNALFDTYPSEKDGVPLLNIDYQVGESLYELGVKGNLMEHLEVIKDVEFGKERDLVTLPLIDFIKSRNWLTLRAKRLEEIEN